MNVSHPVSQPPMFLPLLLSCFETVAPATEPTCADSHLRYQDADSDGAGDASHVYAGCEEPEGYVSVAGDCDDADPERSTDCPDSGGAE